MKTLMLFESRDVYHLNMCLWGELDRIERSYSFEEKDYKNNQRWQAIRRLLDVSYNAKEVRGMLEEAEIIEGEEA